MIFNKAEIEVLALCGLCKNLPVNGCRNIPQDILFGLECLGLIKQSKNGFGYRLTTDGEELLRLAEMNYSQDKIYVSYSDKLIRRIQTAEITSFFWRYGVDVFGENQPAEKSRKVFLPSFVFRRQSATNILGASRLLGFYYTPETVFIPYYITKDNKGFYPNVEQRTFYAETLSLKRKPHIIFTGEGELKDIIEAIKTHNPKPKRNTAIYYDDGMGEIICPISIIPLNENGMRQLRILEIPDYKQLLLNAILENEYLPPDNELFDGRDKTTNYAIGIDCNIKRFEKIVKSNLPANVVVLPFQAEMVQSYLGGSKAICYTLQLDDIEVALGIKKHLPAVDNRPFITEKGKYVDVPLIGKIKGT